MYDIITILYKNTCSQFKLFSFCLSHIIPLCKLVKTKLFGFGLKVLGRSIWYSQNF